MVVTIEIVGKGDSSLREAIAWTASPLDGESSELFIADEDRAIVLVAEYAIFACSLGRP